MSAVSFVGKKKPRLKTAKMCNRVFMVLNFKKDLEFSRPLKIIQIK
jgi:hypothetical protein